MKKSFSKSHFIVLFFLLGFFAVPILQATQPNFNQWKALTLIIDKIERFYVDDVDADALLKNALEGILAGLDEHSVYLDPEEYKAWKEKYNGYYGIGLKYTFYGKQPVVSAVVKDGPAHRSGIRIGDKIQRIQGVKVTSKKTEEIKQLIFGPPESIVSIQVFRDEAKDTLLFNIKREQVMQESITCSFMYNDSTGFIKIASFTKTTPTEFDVAFAQLMFEGMKYLVLDLRDNGGGDFLAGIDVADRFIDGGKLIVFTKGRSSQSNQQFMATEQNTLAKTPLLVIVNRSTASDAEIVAGAIQDWDRGIIVGEPTFGKAVIQTEFPLPDGSALLLTTARYYTPLGRLIQKEYKENGEKTAEVKTVRTAKGRQLEAWGGIVPDFRLHSNAEDMDEITYKNLIKAREYILEFVDQNINRFLNVNHQTESPHFIHIPSVVLNEFKVFMAQSGVALDDPKTSKYAIILLRQQIAERIWGEHGRNIISIMLDETVQKSLKYLQDAEKLLF